MKAHTRRPAKDKAFLKSVAKTVGFALGTIAAKADAVQKALRGSRVARATSATATHNLTKSRRGVRPAASIQRAGRRAAKARAARHRRTRR
jgi:hypothetical protein